MKTRHFINPSLLILVFLSIMGTGAVPRSQAASPQAVLAPVLKWQLGGCYASWCETGWYSSPAVADLDGDGSPEVIGSAYSIVVLDGATGALEWRVASGHDRREPSAASVGRTWPGIAVADLDGNGDLEIITAHSGGYVSVYDHQGYFEPGWPQQPAPGSELRSLAVSDLDGDGSLEVLVAATRSENQWFVFEHNGSLRAGAWPQHAPDSNTNGYTAGAYNQNLAAGDLDGDGRAEIVGPNDTHYLAAFQDDGSQVRASAVYGKNPDGTEKFWSRVGVHVDHAVDLRGYAECGAEHRPNFAHSAPVIVDVDGDGVLETVVVGNVYNCGISPYTDLYEMPFLFNADRTRWQGEGYDWTSIPVPDGGAAPLSEDYNRIESSLPNPAAADLDGDGNLEILYPSYDGRMHAYWLDKSEHGSWPYSVYHPSEGFLRFASEPAAADLDLDGKAEVIFASWTQKDSGQVGKLHILDDQGNPIHEILLPGLKGDLGWNGALAAPTLADLDGDPDLELVLNTAHSGMVAYDLPGTPDARLLWGTGRGSYQRSGSLIQGSLDASVKRVSRASADPGDSLTFTIILRNSGPALSGVSLEDALPAELSFAGGLSASSGTALETGGVITWSGSVPPGEGVTIRYDVNVDADIPGVQVIRNTAIIHDGRGKDLRREAVVVVGGYTVYLPFAAR
jgi:uncharacterized repeat protein (TIGR01451 family)